MEVKPGYKQTEVGVIPEDWEVVNIDDVCDVKSGKRLPKGHSLTAINNGFPYIRVSDMSNGSVDLDDIHYVPLYIAPKIKQYRIYTEDIFISVAGTLGIIGRIPIELNGANLTENADRLTQISCDIDYLYHVLNSKRIQSIIDEQKTTGAQPKLALTRIRKFLIPIPKTREEQRLLSAALSDINSLVTSLEKLIEKKKNIKQGMMQELLTGKRRLPGFTGEWVTMNLNSLCTRITTGRKDVNEGNPNGKYPFFTCSRSISFSNQYSFDTEAILIAGNGDVGTLHYYNGKFEAYQRTYVLSGFEIPAKYLVHFLNYGLIPALNENKIGTSIPYIKIGNLTNLLVNTPREPSEIIAIVSVLDDIDCEIGALSLQLEKYNNLKDGMMQELLSGRIRLI